MGLSPQRNAMGQSTEMSPLVSMLFRTLPNPLKFLMKIFKILVPLTHHLTLKDTTDMRAAMSVEPLEQWFEGYTQLARDAATGGASCLSST